MSSPPPGFALISVRTTSLEMLANTVPSAPETPAGCEVVRWVRPPADEYRALFTAVGGPWGWAGRLLMTDAELAATLNDDRIEIWRLMCDSRVAGFAEMDRRVPGETEIVYFGLEPEFIGRGLGSFLLRWTIHHVWTELPAGPDATATRRLWLHTCDQDGPTALAVYRKAGFRVFDEHVGMEAYPEDFVLTGGADSFKIGGRTTRPLEDSSNTRERRNG